VEAVQEEEVKLWGRGGEGVIDVQSGESEEEEVTNEGIVEYEMEQLVPE